MGQNSCKDGLACVNSAAVVVSNIPCTYTYALNVSSSNVRLTRNFRPSLESRHVSASQLQIAALDGALPGNCPKHLTRQIFCALGVVISQHFAAPRYLYLTQRLGYIPAHALPHIWQSVSASECRSWGDPLYEWMAPTKVLMKAKKPTVQWLERAPIMIVIILGW